MSEGDDIMARALLCPVCARRPRLRDLGFIHARSYGESSRYVIKVECRKWFGLRRCFGPHQSNQIDKGWWDMGARHAVDLWNREARRCSPGWLIRSQEGR